MQTLRRKREEALTLQAVEDADAMSDDTLLQVNVTGDTSPAHHDEHPHRSRRRLSELASPLLPREQTTEPASHSGAALHLLQLGSADALVGATCRRAASALESVGASLESVILLHGSSRELPGAGDPLGAPGRGVGAPGSSQNRGLGDPGSFGAPGRPLWRPPLRPGAPRRPPLQGSPGGLRGAPGGLRGGVCQAATGVSSARARDRRVCLDQIRARAGAQWRDQRDVHLHQTSAGGHVHEGTSSCRP